MADELELTLSYEGNDAEEYGEEIDYGESDEEVPKTSVPDATVITDQAKQTEVEQVTKPVKKVGPYLLFLSSSEINSPFFFIVGYCWPASTFLWFVLFLNPFSLCYLFRSRKT